MLTIQSPIRARRRIPKLSAARRQGVGRVQAEAMLRDIAFVLHATEVVKKSMLAGPSSAAAKN